MRKFILDFKKRKLTLLFFIAIASLCHAQIQKYHYDKEMIFLSDAANESGISVRFNSKDKTVPVYSIGFNSKKESIRNTINFYYSYRKNIYRMDGILYNEKYAAANGFRTFRAASPVRYFKKASDSLYNYKSYKNLEKRIAKDKHGTEIELFVAQLNDNIEYSEPAVFYLSEHYGISPGLGKGELVVFANYKFNSGSNAGDFVEIKDISTDLYLNKNQIEALIEDRYREFMQQSHQAKTPIYCSVTAFSKNTDDKTKEELNDFIGHMCDYYDLWSNQEKFENFNSYFDTEYKRRVDIYRRNGNLNDKQIKIYSEEITRLKNQNLKENFDYK